MPPESNLIWGRAVRCSESMLRMWNILLMANSEPIESTGRKFVFTLHGDKNPVVMGETEVFHYCVC